MTKDKPAFPSLKYPVVEGGEEIGEYANFEGMTVRQYYKAAALQGVVDSRLRTCEEHELAFVADLCGQLADFLIAEDEQHAKEGGQRMSAHEWTEEQARKAMSEKLDPLDVNRLTNFLTGWGVNRARELAEDIITRLGVPKVEWPEEKPTEGQRIDVEKENKAYNEGLKDAIAAYEQARKGEGGMSDPIKKVYEKFKHMDKLFYDNANISKDNPYHLALLDFWFAIKKHVNNRPKVTDAEEQEDSPDKH